MNVSACCIWGVLLLSLGRSAGSPPLASYHYRRAVTDTLSQPELVAINLDGSMWQAIGTAHVDIRIADQHGRAVPHLMRRAGSRDTRQIRDLRPSRIDTLTDHEENQVELQISLEKDGPGANLIDFSTPRKDFEKFVSIWGIASDGTENLLVKQARIFDYSRFADVRETAVALPEDSIMYRKFRIRMEDVVDEAQLPMRWETRRYEGSAETQRETHTRILTRPFRMDAVRLYRQRIVEAGIVPRRHPQTLASVSSRQERDPAATVVEINHDGSPLTALLLACTDSNFSRQAKVEIPIRRDGREAWQQIAAGQLMRISFRDFQHASLQLSFPETRSQRFRLTLFEHDNPPLHDVSVSGKGPVWQAVFLAEPQNLYAVYYGARGQPQPPQYDLVPLERLLGQDHEPVVLHLATAQDNPHFQKAGFLAGDTAMRILFALAIIVMLAVLAAGLYRASQQNQGDVNEELLS